MSFDRRHALRLGAAAALAANFAAAPLVRATMLYDFSGVVSSAGVVPPVFEATWVASRIHRCAISNRTTRS